MNKAIDFVKEAWAELKQVAWLTTPQMIASTWIVIVMVTVVALYIVGVDRILAFFISLVI